MPDQPNKIDDKQQPTHSAAKVVIPFDIDLSAIEMKLSYIERRMAAVSGSVKVSGQESMPSRSEAGQSVGDMGTEKQLMMTTMMRMADLLRQINDMVTLIYNTQINNG